MSTPELPSAQPPISKRPVKHTGDKCTHNLVLFQNLLKEMEEIKRFTKSPERKFEELEMALRNISGKNNVNYSNNEYSPLLLENLKKCISNLEKELIQKDAVINFLLKQKNETINNTSSVNKTVIDNDEIVEIERGNSSLSSNSKPKIETQTEPLIKKEIVLTEDGMVNGISEKGLSVNHKVKIVNFTGGTSKKILEELDVTIKENPDDLIVHVGTSDITNNVNLLTNVKKIFSKVSRGLPSTSIAFSSIISRKGKTNTQKSLTDTNARLKNFVKQKGISFIDYSSIKDFELGKSKLHLNKKGNSAFAKNLLHDINSRTD